MPIPLSVVVPALLVAPPAEHAAHGVNEIAVDPARVGGERGVALRAGMGLDWRRFLFHGGLLGLLVERSIWDKETKVKQKINKNFT